MPDARHLPVHPQAGPTAFSREFPYGIMYVERADDIWSIAVMPLRRKPDYWRHRLT